MSAFYTFLSSLYNCLLKFISLIISLAEVRNFIGEVQKISGEVQSNAHHPAPPPKLGKHWVNLKTDTAYLLQCAVYLEDKP